MHVQLNSITLNEDAHGLAGYTSQPSCVRAASYSSPRSSMLPCEVLLPTAAETRPYRGLGGGLSARAGQELVQALVDPQEHLALVLGVAAAEVHVQLRAAPPRLHLGYHRDHPGAHGLPEEGTNPLE